jgi:uncharacterized protein (DUF2147 family)
MKRFLTLIFSALLCWTLQAQEPGDAIIGTYFSSYHGDDYKVRISKRSDGTYRAKVIWMKYIIDPKTGEKRLDKKNPDKSLRNTPCDEVVLINSLKYIPEKNHWGNTKLYDPQHGIKVNVDMWFVSETQLALRGQLMGIGMTIYWEKQS